MSRIKQAIYLREILLKSTDIRDNLEHYPEEELMANFMFLKGVQYGLKHGIYSMTDENESDPYTESNLLLTTVHNRIEKTQEMLKRQLQIVRRAK
jgi:hypothetical protein